MPSSLKTVDYLHMQMVNEGRVDDYEKLMEFPIIHSTVQFSVTPV